MAFASIKRRKNKSSTTSERTLVNFEYFSKGEIVTQNFAQVTVGSNTVWTQLLRLELDNNDDMFFADSENMFGNILGHGPTKDLLIKILQDGQTHFIHSNHIMSMVDVDNGAEVEIKMFTGKKVVGTVMNSMLTSYVGTPEIVKVAHMLDGDTLGYFRLVEAKSGGVWGWINNPYSV